MSASRVIRALLRVAGAAQRTFVEGEPVNFVPLSDALAALDKAIPVEQHLPAPIRAEHVLESLLSVLDVAERAAVALGTLPARRQSDGAASSQVHPDSALASRRSRTVSIGAGVCPPAGAGGSGGSNGG